MSHSVQGGDPLGARWSASGPGTYRNPIHWLAPLDSDAHPLAVIALTGRFGPDTRDHSSRRIASASSSFFMVIRPRM
jgi:hypothetical protein